MVGHSVGPGSWRNIYNVDVHTSDRHRHKGAPRLAPFSVCSWVQIGIEKSRSQLKLEVQRIWRDKIPIISRVLRLRFSVPSIPSVAPRGREAGGRWANEVTEGGGGEVGPRALTRTQFH